jgi:hypothetical protein
MRNFLFLVAVIALCTGCGSEPQASASTPANKSANLPPGGSGGSDIAPMTTAPVGTAPISGGNNIGEGGGGVQQAIKDKAKQTANNPSTTAGQEEPPNQQDQNDQNYQEDRQNGQGG